MSYCALWQSKDSLSFVLQHDICLHLWTLTCSVQLQPMHKAHDSDLVRKLDSVMGAYGAPSFASTSGLLDVISTGTFALVRGCLFFFMLILGLVFFALRRERPIALPVYAGEYLLLPVRHSLWTEVCYSSTTECGCLAMIPTYTRAPADMLSFVYCSDPRPFHSVQSTVPK